MNKKTKELCINEMVSLEVAEEIWKESQKELLIKLRKMIDEDSFYDTKDKLTVKGYLLMILDNEIENE